jgi:hypothetical protein
MDLSEIEIQMVPRSVRPHDPNLFDFSSNFDLLRVLVVEKRTAPSESSTRIISHEQRRERRSLSRFWTQYTRAPSSTSRFVQQRRARDPSPTMFLTMIISQFNKDFETVVSADERGMVEYWHADTFKFPEEWVDWKFKSETDLYDFPKSKAVPTSLEFSADGTLFATMGSDMHIRIFKFATGKLYRKIDETVETYKAAQRDDKSPYKIEAIDFGRRMAIETQLAANETAAASNVIFDQTGNFIMFSCMLGIKLVNITLNKLETIIGKEESGERYLKVRRLDCLPTHSTSLLPLNDISRSLCFKAEQQDLHRLEILSPTPITIHASSPLRSRSIDSTFSRVESQTMQSVRTVYQSTVTFSTRSQRRRKLLPRCPLPSVMIIAHTLPSFTRLWETSPSKSTAMNAPRQLRISLFTPRTIITTVFSSIVLSRIL